MKFSFKKTAGYGAVIIITVIAAIAGYVKFFLPNVDAAPYLKVENTSERIERGKYLANHVAVCMDCHSSRDWSRFSAPLAEGTLGMGGEFFGPEMGFPGKFYSKNITPAHLGSWTDGEIFRAITTGVNKQGEPLFPVMPYRNYSKMDKEDIYDIIAYLRSLDPVENEIPASEADFPMNFILRTIPKNAEFAEKPHPSQKEEYGGYLVNAAGCIDCHTQVKNGQIIPEMAFSGGRKFKMPTGVLRSANITPDTLTGIGSWSEEIFVNRFKSYSNPENIGKVGEGEFNTLMPWSMYAGMKKSDLEAIYAYLQTLDPVKNEVVLYERR